MIKIHLARLVMVALLCSLPMANYGQNAPEPSVEASLSGTVLVPPLIAEQA
jgi:hypothetical protein